MDSNNEHRYGRCNLRPKGVAENLTRCAQPVTGAPNWGLLQCSRRRGHGEGGEYCKQHARMISETFDAKEEPIWQKLKRLSASIPESEWERVPSDLAERLDHYLNNGMNK